MPRKRSGWAACAGRVGWWAAGRGSSSPASCCSRMCRATSASRQRRYHVADALQSTTGHEHCAHTATPSSASHGCSCHSLTETRAHDVQPTIQMKQSELRWLRCECQLQHGRVGCSCVRPNCSQPLPISYPRALPLEGRGGVDSHETREACEMSRQFFKSWGTSLDVCKCTPPIWLQLCVPDRVCPVVSTDRVTCVGQVH